MRTRRILSVLAALFLMLPLSSTIRTFATDYTVDATTACTLADAVQAANGDQAVGNCSAGDGDDTIFLSGDITLGGNLPTIRSTVTVTSNDHQIKRVISGNQAYRIFNVDQGANLTLQCLQLIDGRGHGIRGGAVRVLQGHAHLIDVRMENNWAEKGGGALRVGNGSSANCQMCQFVDNHSPVGGAIWVGDEGSSLILANSMVYNNSADQGGGMYIKQGSATISGTTFSNNSAAEGPDLLSDNAEITLRASSRIATNGMLRR